MGVNIRGAKAPATEKPLFEAIEEPAPKPQPKMQVSAPKKPPVALEPGYGEWGDMQDVPRDRRVIVACNTDSQPNKWFYHRVQWQQDGPMTGPGLYIAGTEWHKLGEGMAKGWREDIGHP